MGGPGLVTGVSGDDAAIGLGSLADADRSGKLSSAPWQALSSLWGRLPSGHEHDHRDPRPDADADETFHLPVPAPLRSGKVRCGRAWKPCCQPAAAEAGPMAGSAGLFLDRGGFRRATRGLRGVHGTAAIDTTLWRGSARAAPAAAQAERWDAQIVCHKFYVRCQSDHSVAAGEPCVSRRRP